MPVQELVPGPNPARDDVQQTAFGYDVVSRYICNNWQEITAAQGPGAYPFDVVVIGAGYVWRVLRRKTVPAWRRLRSENLDVGCRSLLAPITHPEPPAAIGRQSGWSQLSSDAGR